jgi:hypothetical protein
VSGSRHADLLEAQAERHHQTKLTSAKDSFDYPLILGT